LSPPRLYLSHDGGLDWLIALEFGRVDDAQPPECWRAVNGQFALLHDVPGGRVLGLKVLAFSEFDPEGEVVIAARAYFAGRDSLNRELFRAATAAEGEDAVALWRRCLEAGDAMAHFALGYTLLGLGRAPEAYRHLRHYTEIAPHGSWNWCWYGMAAGAVGELVEARRAYRRAIELEEAGDQETEARELLAALPDPVAARSASGVVTSRAAAAVLWGDELPQLGRRRVEALSGRSAAGLTAGRRAKSYAYTDPNEDAVAILEGQRATVVVCADGHNGMTSVRAALAVVLERLAGEPPVPTTSTTATSWDSGSRRTTPSLWRRPVPLSRRAARRLSWRSLPGRGFGGRRWVTRCWRSSTASGCAGSGGRAVISSAGR
jgi:hypothetical protein